MKNQIFTALIFGMSSWHCSYSQKSDSKPDKPNLVFIFSDQQSFDMLGCYGNSQIKTPNIDRLASEGIRFNHCVSSCPVCTPYRGMLLSGMHPLKNGAISNDIQMLPGNENYFGEVLRDAGYHTGYFGKWHLYGGDRVRPVPSGPFRYGFDNEFLTNNCTLVYDSIRSYFWNEKGEKELYNDWEFNAQTKQAIKFIDGNAQKPFALFLSWHAPHDWSAGKFGDHKYTAPKDFEKLYNPDSIRLRENCEDTERHRLFYQGHMAMISALDKNFGDIIKRLEEKGIADNSIIIFTSDHGDMLESHNWPFNKGRPEIESIRVPLIIKWANNLQARGSDLLVGTLDLMPTVLGLMGFPLPETCDGENLSQLIIEKNDTAIRSVPLFYFSGDWRGVYTHDYTYAFSLEKGDAEPHAENAGFRNYSVLYNHKNDPYELSNLFANEEFEQQKNKLHKLALEWMEKFGDQGIPFKELLPEVMVEEDYMIYKKSPKDRGSNWDGRLKRRPVDFMKN